MNSPLPLLTLSLLLSFSSAIANPAAASTPAKIRCGWFDNPTPGNAWFTDQEGEWTIGMQGGHQAKGPWPKFTSSQWVKTNGSYGHGCACLKIVTEAETRDISRIISAQAVSLNQCRKNHALKEPIQPL